MKKAVSLLIALVMILSVTTAFAAPYSVSSGYSGNTKGLIVITNPEYQKSNTLERNYTITGYGNNGVNVGVYRLSGGNYVRFANFGIGASGLFMRQVNLYNGKNSLMLIAENGWGGVQTERLEITLLNQKFFDTIRGLF